MRHLEIDGIRLSESGLQALQLGVSKAKSLRYPFIDDQLLLLGVLEVDPNPTVLEYFEIDAGKLKSDLKEPAPGVVARSSRLELPLAARARRIITFAAEEARADFLFVTAYHLFLGFLKEGDSRAYQALKAQGLEYAKVTGEKLLQQKIKPIYQTDSAITLSRQLLNNSNPMRSELGRLVERLG